MSRRHIHLSVATSVLVLGLLGGCANQEPKTLGALRYEPEPEPAAETTTASHEQVREEYEDLLTMVEDEQIREQIQRRIGDVYMMEGEKSQLEAKADPGRSYYLEAIKSYREILEKYPNSPDNAEILYQLAKAYDMEGNEKEALAMLRELTSRHPNYKNSAEANFRKGDILFNLGGYREAERAYRVASDYEDSNFYLNARYMLGWSQYKQLRFRDAMGNFVQVLNNLLAAGAMPDDLPKPKRSLVDDTLHAVSLSLDKLAGAASIQSFPELKEQHYVWLVYDNLGQYYLEKELYEASAESYRKFVDHYGDKDITPILHRKMIETYVAGAFPRQAFTEKERFVDAYGINSDYSRERGGIPDAISDTMRDYLDELSRNYHAHGQELQKQIASLKSDKKRQPTPEKLKTLDSEALAALNKAAYFYQVFIDTFPNYEKLDELIFLRADALFAARRYDESIPDYEQVAYRPQTPIADQYGADAGYAAIVAYEKHVAGLPEKSRENYLWRADAVKSMLRFIDKYHQDPRSASVLTNTADYMFSLEQYERALEIARALIDKPDLDPELKKNAYGISAHSLFQLQRYAEAAKDYLAQRRLVTEGSKEYRQITERLASAVYKDAESLLAREDKPGAVKELLWIKDLAPDSPVRITAQYDAATLLLELKRWPEAIAQLEELDRAYPNHKLATEFPRKLAFAYEKNENWKEAAKEYKRLANSDPDPALRQEALYLSATMYQKADNIPAAIEQFKAYAHGYPQPFAKNMEASYQLALDYETLGDLQKRLFWLQKLVEGHRDAGKQQNERSRWLAAWANTQYGDYFAEEYGRHHLYLPLDKSLPAKNKALEKATDRYEAAADSGIFEFVTESAFKIGELYQSLATDLRQSPRPKGLGEEEQKLYSQILAEQSRPFDEIAMELHRSNIQRAWDGDFNRWINQSFAMMRQLDPARFAKTETIVSYGDEIR